MTIEQHMNTNHIKKKKDFVGDPIIDAGLVALTLLLHKDIDQWLKEDLKSQVEYLVQLFLKPAWSREIQSIFPNSTYIQSAKNYNKEEKSKEFLYELVDALFTVQESDRYCVFCGNSAYQRNDEKTFSKTQIPLIGSSDFTNFFPSLRDGIEICARCVLAIQFAPLLFYKSGGKPCCVSCNNKQVLLEYGKECSGYIYSRLSSGDFDVRENSGIFDEGFKTSVNAIFHLAYKLATLYKRKGILKENEEIVLYHLDNYNQNPNGITIFKINNKIFRFIIAAMNSPNYKKAWYRLVYKYYKGNEKPLWKTSSYNTIHDYLLNSQSILWAFKNNKTRNINLPWPLIEHYMLVVREMNKQRLELIKNFADNIAQCIEESKNKKRIENLNSAKDIASFRNEIKRISRDWQKLGKTEPLVKYDDFVTILNIGEYSSWKEVQDLIIIRLYEKLHQWLVKEPIGGSSEDELTQEELDSDFENELENNSDLTF